MAVLTKGLSELFEEFLRGFEDKDGERKYQVILAQMAASGRKSVIVDYEDLIHFNTDLAESLLKDPDKALKECKSAAFEVLSTENPGYAGEIRKSLTIRLRGVTDRVNLRKVDTSHLDKMIAFAGMLVRTSELRPLLVDAAFVCPDGHTTRVIQEGPSIKKPAKCEGCDETRNFELDQKDSVFIDSQILRVQELPEELPPGQLPRFFDIDVEGDIVNTARPGDRAIMTGIVRAEQDFAFGIPRSRSFRSKIDANYIEVVGKEPSQVHITKEDEAIIKSIAAGADAYQKLIKSMAPGILGHEAVKEAILLLLVGGPQTVLPDGTKLRGDINVFLVGDPGVAKSEMLKFAAQVAPRGMFASGRGSTAAGLSAAVIREKNTLMLEAGVVVLADQGIACLHPESAVLLDGKVVKVGRFAETLEFTPIEAANGRSELAALGSSVVSFKIDSLSSGTGNASRIRRRWHAGEIVRLTLRSGFVQMVTPDHLFLDGNSLEWKEAAKFACGDFLTAPQTISWEGAGELLLWDIIPKTCTVSLTTGEKGQLRALLETKFGSVNRAAGELGIPRISNYFRNRLQPTLFELRRITQALGVEDTWRRQTHVYDKSPVRATRITPELAYICGFIFGDGNVRISPRRAAITLTQSPRHGAYTARFENYWRLHFDKFKLRKTRRSRSTIRGKAVSSERVDWSVSRRILGHIYLFLTQDHLANLPSLPEEVLKAFVAGVTDSDGYHGPKHSEKNGALYETWNVVYEASKDREANLNLLLALRRFGVIGSYRGVRGGVGTIVVSSRADCTRLQEALSVYSVKMARRPTARKRNISGASEKLPKSVVAHVFREVFQDAERTPLIKAGVWSTIYGYMKELRQPSTGQVVQVASRTTHISGASRLARIAEKNYFLDEVVGVAREPYEGYVYDLMMQSDHNYVADGVFSHNCIDEFDKMKPEDRSALHEQMEQQSYHPSTEVLLSSGKVRIGDYVEEAIRGHPELVEPGKDCEILRVSPSDRIFSVNLGSGIVEKTAISNLSRHRAPNRFVKATFSNGRSILVTPEHPIFAFCGAGISTIPAEKLQIGSFIPGPTRIPNSSMAIALAPVTSSKLFKKITQPASLTLKTARILGYLVTEGNFYVGSTVEVDFTNLDERLLAEMRTLTRDEFGFEPTIRVSGGRKVGLRYLSTTLHAWFSENFPEMVCKARSKRAPAKILSASVAHINEFLTAAFLGDGGVETDAVCYRTASRGLAEDYQDLLLKLEIASRIVPDRSNDSFKVYITGDSLREFLDRVVDPLDHRRDRIHKLVDRSRKNNRSHDVLPTGVAQTLIQLLEDAGMSYDGYFWRHLKSGNGITKSTVERLLSRLEDRRRTVLSLSAGRRTVKELRAATGWSQERLAKECGVKRGVVEHLERGGYGSEQAGKLAETISGVINERFASLGESIEFIRGIMGLRFLRVTKVESVLNEGRARTEWVYDVTVEPRHNFVSAGIVLHNTVTIAKGGIYATLNARTAILAATNPILGKYNPYQNLIDNITLPIPLLTRFDLIFVLRDTPIPGQDEKLATHILDVHRKRAYVESPPIQFELLKKYIAFAKNYSPVLTMEAENRIKEYYLQLRRSATEGQIGATPRTLESLIRLASAKARLMLREEVTEDDALTAISLMNKMVEDVLTDTETKTKGDFGILLGQPAGERGKLATVMDTLRGLEGPDRKPIEAKLFRQELMKTNKFANEDEVDNLIKKITKEGIIFESKPGFFRRVQG